MILTRVVLPEPLGADDSQKIALLDREIDADEDGRPAAIAR